MVESLDLTEANHPFAAVALFGQDPEKDVIASVNLRRFLQWMGRTRL
jgi:hypothetical protein